jgi:hypothetical protein
MNLTPLQERRLKQVEGQVAFFSKEVQTKKSLVYYSFSIRLCAAVLYTGLFS